MGLTTKSRFPNFQGPAQAQVPTPTFSGRLTDVAADSINPYTSQGPGAGGAGQTYDEANNIINFTTDGLVAHWDAADVDSWNGTGQRWLNLVASPADGELQTAYDLILGADETVTAQDPSFVGTPGSASAYWSIEGNEVFKLAAGNTDLTDGVASSSSPEITIEAWVYVPESGGTTNTIGLFSNGRAGVSNSSYYAGITQGKSWVVIDQVPDPNPQVMIADNTITFDAITQVVLVLKNGGPSATYYNGVQQLINTGQSTSSTSWSSTGVSSVPVTYGLMGNTVWPTHGFPTGGRMYNSKIYNKALSSTEVLENFNALKDRYGL